METMHRVAVQVRNWHTLIFPHCTLSVYASSAANVTITNGTYAGNTASIEGGAIYLQGNTTTPVTLRLIGNVTFAANNAPAGGALALFGSQSDLGSAVLLPRPGDTVCCENVRF